MIGLAKDCPEPPAVYCIAALAVPVVSPSVIDPAPKEVADPAEVEFLRRVPDLTRMPPVNEFVPPKVKTPVPATTNPSCPLPSEMKLPAEEAAPKLRLPVPIRVMVFKPGEPTVRQLPADGAKTSVPVPLAVIVGLMVRLIFPGSVRLFAAVPAAVL